MDSNKLYLFFIVIDRNLALIRRLDEQPLVWIFLEIIATG